MNNYDQLEGWGDFVKKITSPVKKVIGDKASDLVAQFGPKIAAGLLAVPTGGASVAALAVAEGVNTADQQRRAADKAKEAAKREAQRARLIAAGINPDEGMLDAGMGVPFWNAPRIALAVGGVGLAAILVYLVLRRR